MSTTAYLATFGVTLEQANAFVMSNLGNPQLIYDTALQYGVTNQMLGEIAGGYTAREVRGFFDARGLDSGALDESYAVGILPAGLESLAPIMGLNANTGVLSNAALRDRVAAQTGSASYDAAFDPTLYVGAFDGTLSPEDLGFSELGTLPATPSTLESLFYGSLINGIRNVDPQEVQAFKTFVAANKPALLANDVTVFNEYVALMAGIMEDPATPWLSDAEIADLAVVAGQYYVQTIAVDHDLALIDGLFSGFI